MHMASETCSLEMTLQGGRDAGQAVEGAQRECGLSWSLTPRGALGMNGTRVSPSMKQGTLATHASQPLAVGCARGQ